MSQPADEKRLGELLINTGKLSSEELMAALETQQGQGGPGHKRLGEVLLELGHISRSDLQNAITRAESPPEHVAGPHTPPIASAAQAESLPNEVVQALADPNRRIGRYVVISELGRGGMGVVYRGYDPQLRREVAIKMIATEVANGNLVARFMREAQACAKLHHPSIVTVHEVGEHGRQPYLVMDLVKGQILANMIDDESLSLRDLVSVALKIAKALDHAHSAGIIHRDVKPDNIILSEEGQPLLMDFGLARETSAQQQLTKTGQMLGTPLYMAPEQVKGSGLGPWTDIYALGAVLYRGLTGTTPFSHENAVSLFRAILLDEPRSPRARNADVPPDLDTITLKCLEKEPRSRYPSASTLADDLQRFLDGQEILARPTSRSERGIRWVRRNPALSASLTLVVTLVVGGVAGGLHMKQEAELEAVRREESARLSAEKAARDREKDALEQATLQQREQQAAASLQKLRGEVSAVLDMVRSGALLSDPNNARLARTNLLKHQHRETVKLLVVDLDALSQRLAEDQGLDGGQELFLRFLCEMLADLDLAEEAVPALTRYIQTELSLPAKAQNQLRAVPAGTALCLLGGEEAERQLLEARDGFGVNETFWGQVKRSYPRTGVAPDLDEARTAASYINRGMALHDKGDIDGAIKDYTRAIDIDPNLAEAWSNRGALHGAKGDLDSAIADYTRAIDIDPSLAIAWANRGLARKTKGQLEDSIADSTRALEIDPNLSLAWAIRGHARHARGDFDDAISDLTRAIEIDPNLASARTRRGHARRAKGDLNGAMDDYTRSIDIDPAYFSAWLNRGLTRHVKGDFHGAINDYTRAIEINPNRAAAWTNRGNVRSDKGDHEGAIADFNRALEIAPSIAATWANRGLARNAQGDLDGAIDDCTRAIEINPNLALAWGNRGLVRKTKGDLDGAIADWQRLLALAPNHHSAPAVRSMIKKARAQQQAKSGAGK